jgi:hypothetical protein
MAHHTNTQIEEAIHAMPTPRALKFITGANTKKDANEPTIIASIRNKNPRLKIFISIARLAAYTTILQKRKIASCSRCEPGQQVARATLILSPSS